MAGSFELEEIPTAGDVLTVTIDGEAFLSGALEDDYGTLTLSDDNDNYITIEEYGGVQIQMVVVDSSTEPADKVVKLKIETQG